MRATDGDILRVRPPGSVLDSVRLEQLATIAEDFADGGVLLTRRAKIELRGIRKSGRVVEALDVAGLGEAPDQARVPDTIIAVASDIDNDADGDAVTLACELRMAAVHSAAMAALADKFAIVVDGGGRAHVGTLNADIRLDAIGADDNAWRFAICGDAASAMPIATLASDDAPRVVLELIERLVTRSPRSRGGFRMRDFAPREIRGTMADILKPARMTEVGSIGPRIEYPIEQRRGANWQSAAFSFGRIEAGALRELAGLARSHGRVRLLPDRSIVVPDGGMATRERLGRMGALVASADPRAAVEACVGRAGCAHGSTDTREHALLCSRAVPSLRAAATRPVVHVSGCVKGCARRRSTTVTLVARDGRYDVVFADGPTGVPAWIGLPMAEVVQRLVELDRAFVMEATPGESAEAFVARYVSAAV